jgi:hypothetical protein
VRGSAPAPQGPLRGPLIVQGDVVEQSRRLSLCSSRPICTVGREQAQTPPHFFCSRPCIVIRPRCTVSCDGASLQQCEAGMVRSPLLQCGARRGERRTSRLVSHVLNLPHNRWLTAERFGPGSTPVAVPSLSAGGYASQAIRDPRDALQAPPCISRVRRSLHRRALYVIRFFPSSHRPF